MKPTRPLLPTSHITRYAVNPSHVRLRPSLRCRSAQPALCRTFLGRSQASSHRAVETLNLNRMREASYDYHIRRRNFLLSGAAAGILAFCYTAYLLAVELQKPKKLDSGLPDKLDPFSTEAGSKRKTVVHDSEGQELVPTGDSVVPTFPRLIEAATGAEGGQEHVNGVEYTLVGLGMRSVTFVGFNVYLVGYYIATQDVAAIQARLIKEINPIATTLVSTEKDELRKALLDPERGEKIWNDILTDVRPRSLFRIVPVRDTNFAHLKDGLVRAIQGRMQNDRAAYGDEAFGKGMQDFKTLFTKGTAPKTKELLFYRDAAGILTLAYNDAKTGMGTMGRVTEERISRLLWLNYLAGSKVASEPARQNIIDGIMEFVERPIGTVATQVV